MYCESTSWMDLPWAATAALNWSCSARGSRIFNLFNSVGVVSGLMGSPRTVDYLQQGSRRLGDELVSRKKAAAPLTTHPASLGRDGVEISCDSFTLCLIDSIIDQVS